MKILNRRNHMEEKCPLRSIEIKIPLYSHSNSRNKTKKTEFNGGLENPKNKENYFTYEKMKEKVL